MAITASRLSSSNLCRKRSKPFSCFIGLAREDPRMVPPFVRMPETFSGVSSIVRAARFSISSGSSVARSLDGMASGTKPPQPYLMPISLWPYRFTPYLTMARIAGLRPGQSPPPVSTAIFMINSPLSRSLLAKNYLVQFARYFQRFFFWQLPHVAADCHSGAAGLHYRRDLRQKFFRRFSFGSAGHNHLGPGRASHSPPK